LGIRLQGAILPALTEFWCLSDRLCGKRIIPFLEARGQLDLAPSLRDLLLRMSPATCDRLLQDVRRKEEPWENILTPVSAYSSCGRSLSRLLLSGTVPGQGSSLWTW
jgi:hypothetical protein